MTSHELSRARDGLGFSGTCKRWPALCSTVAPGLVHLDPTPCLVAADPAAGDAVAVDSCRQQYHTAHISALFGRSGAHRSVLQGGL